jgi:mannosyl-3-phosphoglycerate phosphatase
MLPPHQIFFTALEGTLADPGSGSWTPALEALADLERRQVPLVLAASGTRAQVEVVRRKMGHGYPFITEEGGGLFLPDGYFPQRIDGATRVGRYFCMAIGRSNADATAALEEIATAVKASVVSYSQMTAREIAANTGRPLREAEWESQREFGERFFFAGASEDVIRSFVELAATRGWEAVPHEPFWELRSGNDQGRALRQLMRLYRASMRTRLSSVAIGSQDRDFGLLAAADHAVVLPPCGHENAATLRTIPRAVAGQACGPAGWNSAVLQRLERP